MHPLACVRIFPDIFLDEGQVREVNKEALLRVHKLLHNNQKESIDNRIDIVYIKPDLFFSLTLFFIKIITNILNEQKKKPAHTQ